MQTGRVASREKMRHFGGGGCCCCWRYVVYWRSYHSLSSLNLTQTRLRNPSTRPSELLMLRESIKYIPTRFSRVNQVRFFSKKLTSCFGITRSWISIFYLFKHIFNCSFLIFNLSIWLFWETLRHWDLRKSHCKRIFLSYHAMHYHFINSNEFFFILSFLSCLTTSNLGKISSHGSTNFVIAVTFKGILSFLRLISSH